MKNKLTIFLIIFLSAIALSCTSSGKIEDTSIIDGEELIVETVEPETNVTGEHAEDREALLSGDVSELPAVSGGAKARGESKSEDSFGLRDGEYEIEPMAMLEEELLYAESMAKSAALGDYPGSNPSTHSGLKAGYSDDNRQYGYFLNFLNEYGQQVTALDLNVAERIILNVTDRNGKPLIGSKISVKHGDSRLEGVTLADGTYQINPSGLPGDLPLLVEIEAGTPYQDFRQRLEVERAGVRNINISFDLDRIIPQPIPLDIVFVMDTTGSMGEEIQRLKETIQIIHMNLTSLSVPAEVRFGMVLYKDVGDEYNSMTIPLTSDIELFQTELDLVQAYGGGDTPEDLELALDDLVNNMDWNKDGIKLAYIITDAPPHLDYGRAYTCAAAAEDARRLGIKIYGIGTGGLDLQGEYVLRQMAQYTSARYIFLTYGAESGDSSGGVAGSVSHHTGSNWNADKLESIIIRFAKEELSYLSDSPLLAEGAWFEADKIDTEKAEETLANLFALAVNQLLDFSTWPVTKEFPLAVLPFQYEGKLGAVSEYFNEHFILSTGLNERITLAERKDLGQLLAELELQNVGITEEGRASELGELLNAEILITGNLFQKENKYELFLKMLRTETGEVLAVTRAVIAAELGL